MLQIHSTYGPNYSAISIYQHIRLHYLQSILILYFPAVFLYISVMHSKIYLASSACPFWVIHIHKWHPPYLLWIAILFGTNSCSCLFLLTIFYASLEDVLQNFHSHCSQPLVKAWGSSALLQMRWLNITCHLHGSHIFLLRGKKKKSNFILKAEMLSLS